MLTMNDIRTYQRGQQANAEELAGKKINELVGQEEQQATEMEQQAQQHTERSLEEDANLVLQELQNSENPQAEFEKLPPILQKKVMELMDGGQQKVPEDNTDGQYERQPSNNEAVADDGDGDNDTLPNTPPEDTEQYLR